MLRFFGYIKGKNSITITPHQDLVTISYTIHGETVSDVIYAHEVPQIMSDLKRMMQE